MRRNAQRRMKNVGTNADVAGKNACSTGPQQLADYAVGIFETGLDAADTSVRATAASMVARLS